MHTQHSLFNAAAAHAHEHARTHRQPEEDYSTSSAARPAGEAAERYRTNWAVDETSLKTEAAVEAPGSGRRQHNRRYRRDYGACPSLAAAPGYCLVCPAAWCPCWQQRPPLAAVAAADGAAAGGGGRSAAAEEAAAEVAAAV